MARQGSWGRLSDLELAPRPAAKAWQRPGAPALLRLRFCRDVNAHAIGCLFIDRLRRQLRAPGTEGQRLDRNRTRADRDRPVRVRLRV